jgi:hypothetical protein
MTKLFIVRAPTPDEAHVKMQEHLTNSDTPDQEFMACMLPEFIHLIQAKYPIDSEMVAGIVAGMEALKAAETDEPAVAVYFPETYHNISSDAIRDAFNRLADVFIGEKFTDEDPVSDPSIIKCEDHSKMFRAITSHNVPGLETGIRISAPAESDTEPSNRLYLVSGFNSRNNPAFKAVANVAFNEDLQGIAFVSRVDENGVPDGLTNEALTAILLDRLEVFQSGPFACEENARAMSHYYLALSALHDRTVRLAKEREENAANVSSEGEAASV